MSINLTTPEISELKPRIIVFGCGGAGGNAVNNMITSGLDGVDFVVANTDAQALSMSKAGRIVQMGLVATEGLGAGSHPEVGAAAADEVIDEIRDHLQGAHMVFITAGMGGGTGTGAGPVVAKAARDMGILTVGVVTKPFMFEGQRRMRTANQGIEDLQAQVDTLIVIPNQNLFRIANEKTTFADAFAKADEVLYSGVACITDLMVKEGLINLDFADVRSVMHSMGRAMMGTGEASGDDRALKAAEAAIANPLLDDTSIQSAGGVLISITGGNDLTLFEVDAAATRIREDVDSDANIILGATFDESLEGVIRVSVVATGIEPQASSDAMPSRSSGAAQITGAAKAGEILTAKASGQSTTAHEKNDLETLDAQLRQAASSALQQSVSEQRPAAGPAPRPNQAPAATTAATPTQPKAPAPAQSVSVAGQDVTVTRARPAEMASGLPPVPAATPVAQAEPEPAESFVPPAPQRPQGQAAAPSPAPTTPYPPVPRIDDFPQHAQAEYQAHKAAEEAERQGAVHPQAEPERKPGLFERIASGLQRRETEEFVMSDEPPGGNAAPAAASPQPGQSQQAPGMLAARIEPALEDQSGQNDSDFAKKPQAPRHESSVTQAQRRGPTVSVQPQEDDQYEIPAFLRRQNG
ncbi:MAG: cell division protein FtsZ [Pseudomonadota bacterium]